MSSTMMKYDRSARWRRSLPVLMAIVALCATAVTRAVPPTDEPPTKTREIFVPTADLKVLLESEPHRVLLTRQEYDALLTKAKKTPETHVPHATVPVSSEYEITVGDGRAKLQGTIAIDVLDGDMQAIPLDFGGVGLLAAKLDDQPAPIGYAADGKLNLLVSGQGRHRLTLDMVAPLEMNSAQQFLSFRLTNAAVGRWRLTVPGDVEIKGGADVVSRQVDTTAKVTRFELLPRSGDSTILMSLNSHLQRREQAVAARCMLFDEVTEAYEKLQATVTLWVLHRATDRFRFVVPDGFEITEINSPLMARWDIESQAGRKIVNVRLREQTTDTVVLSVAAIKSPSQLKPWRMPRLELLDVVGQVTVLGLLAQNDLKAESLTASDLIPVDTTVLAAALPATILRPEPGAVPLRYIAAYYAPQAGYDLKADFSRLPTTLSVTTNLLLNIQEKGCEVQGGFALLPSGEKRFCFDFSVPAGWTVSDVAGPDKAPLAIERYTSEKLPGRIHVKLPQGIAPGQIYAASFRAQYTPPGWLSEWKSQSLEFPMFRVLEAQGKQGAQRDEGAVAVVADEDMEVRPAKVEGLVPITEAQMSRFGMPNGAMNLAYRYEGAGGKATIAIDRTKPRATARTFAFFQIVPNLLKSHYVVIYSIDDAKTRRLSLLLPASTPESLTIRGLDGVTVKEFTSQLDGTARRWNVLLDEARRGEIRLAIDFEMRPQSIGETLPPEKQKPAAAKADAAKPDAAARITELKDFELPLVKADAVVYQSGLVAIEGDLELDVNVKTDARRADVGQLAIAKYTPVSIDPNQQAGPKQAPLRLLGTYDFVGDAPKIAVDVFRNPSYALTPAIIERAKLTTLLSADGTSQTQAVFQLRTKASYLEIELPEKASLWSAVLDGTPLKPQKRGDVRLIGLPPGSSGAARSLQLVYEAPVQSLASGQRMSLTAPRLLYRTGRDAKTSKEIPLVNIEWNVTVPDGYEAVATDGTLECEPLERPVPAPLVVAGTLYELGGGYEPHGMSFGMRDEKAKSAAKNSLRQFEETGGGAKFSEAKTAVTASPTRRRADISQDNMISELERDAKDEGKSADQKAGAAQKVPMESPPQVESAGAARILLGANAQSDATVTMPWRSRGAGAGPAPPAPVPSAPAPPMASPAPPASTGPTATYSGAISGLVGSVTVTPPPATAAAPAAEPQLAQPPVGPSAAAGKPAYQRGSFLGVRSLKIDVEQSGMNDRQLLTFNSLGADPRIGITLARRDRNVVLVWGIALAVFIIGMGFTTRPVRQKVSLILVLALASALVPLAWDTVSVARICNGVFYAASLLVPYFLAAGIVRWILQRLRSLVGRICVPAPATAATSAMLVLALIMFLSATAQAQPQPAGGQNPTAESFPPVAVPEDAIIIPYDVKSKTGVQDADHLMVPYDRYVELWNRAYPDKRIDAHPAPLPYALSGAVYSAVLEGEETLNLAGTLRINVLAEGYVSIPLGLRGGVLARADLDGKPAKLKVVSAAHDTVQQGKGGKVAAAMDETLLLLQVSGKGSHKLELEVRLKLGHVGGWRGTTGSLPTAPAATVTFRVPQPQTEVRLGQAVDRRIHETQRPDETLETALGPGGALQLQWRPKVAEAQVDRGLTVETAGLLDVQEDGLRMALHIKLEFRRGQRDSFTLSLPAEYLVEKVAGGNVRGWEVRRAAAGPAPGQTEAQTVEVSLLKTAKESEQINLFLSRGGKVGQAPFETFAVPMVTVRDAALSSGQLTIRRSPLLDLRTTKHSGVTRIDLGPLPDLSGGPATDESVLAIRPYEAYRFPATPFVLQLRATPTVAEVMTEAETSVKLDPNEPGLESKIIFHIGQRRIYRLEMAVPEDLRLPEVTLPSAGIWSIEKHGPRSVLEVYLQQGALGDVAIILRGKLSALDKQREMALPRLEVLGVKRQEGDIAVEADPAFTVEAHDLHDCQETELERVAAWLDPQFRAATRVALHYASGGHAGKLRLVPRTPEVVCDTVSNVRVTDRAVEETIFLNYSIRNAGVHELTFLLPASMADARITTPLLRQKTITAVDAKPDSPLRVHLELQADVMNDLRVLVENDRLLTPGSHTAPLPGFETAAGRQADFVRHQYAVLQTTNRDELVVEPLAGLETLSRQQQQWQTLSELLGSKEIYQAYLVQAGAADPRLSFHFARHEEVETARARIDLAQTTLVVDANGAYRAKLELSLDNSSEQFLDVELPEGSKLWTVHVAGEPVKPAEVPGTTDAHHVLLPVQKTAKGDLNYLVVLKYGGQMPPLTPLSTLRFPLVRNVKSYPRQVAISIEQSQVEIYVPTSQQWFDFGGTVHATTDESELKAGRIAAFNKQGERLIEATHDKDPFARVRATENLKNWVEEAQKNDGEAGRRVNKALESQISASSSTAQQAKDILQKSAEGMQQDEELKVDNRKRLNDLYQTQGNVIAGTQVLSGADSYSGGTTISAGVLAVQNGSDFNDNWIARNSLSSNDAGAAQTSAPTSGITVNGGAALATPYYQQDGKQYVPPVAQGDMTKLGVGALTLGNGGSYGSTTTINGGLMQNTNPNIASGRVILNNEQQFGGQVNLNTANPFLNYQGMGGGGAGGAGLGFAQSQPQLGAYTTPSPAQSNGALQFNAPAQQQQPSGYGRRGGVRDDQQRDLAEYRQKLAKEINPNQAPGGMSGEQTSQKPRLGLAGSLHDAMGDLSAANVPLAPPAAPAPPKSSGSGSEGAIAVTLLADSPSMAQSAAPTAPTGLASLDFELPTDKSLYEIHRFTTPRGEAELTARTISNATVAKLELLAALAAACLLMWVAYGLIRRGALAWFRHPLGATLLTFAGLASFCGGVLPVAGLIAIVSGIVFLILHFWRRRDTATASA